MLGGTGGMVVPEHDALERDVLADEVAADLGLQVPVGQHLNGVAGISRSMGKVNRLDRPLRCDPAFQIERALRAGGDRGGEEQTEAAQ